MKVILTKEEADRLARFVEAREQYQAVVEAVGPNIVRLADLFADSAIIEGPDDIVSLADVADSGVELGVRI